MTDKTCRDCGRPYSLSIEGMPCEPDEVSQEITVRRMDIRQFREMGLLQEINRLILHPAGLALEVVIDSETGEERFGGVWDAREDPEGVLYGEDYLNPEKAKTVAYLLDSRAKVRKEKLGYVVQPLDPEHKQLVVRILEPTQTRIAPPGKDDEGEES